MPFRIATLNLEQDHKRWEARQPLIANEIVSLRPDIMAFNEVSIPLQTAKALRDRASMTAGLNYNLVQQTRTNGLSQLEGEALLTGFPIIETGNLDFQTRDIVALLARLLIGDVPIDVYVTHLYMSRGDDSLRLFQVQQLLRWISSRSGAAASIICGDFNASLGTPSADLMAEHFRPTQTAPTAFTPLADHDGSVSHPYWPRMDRCIDYIWISTGVAVNASAVCFNQPSDTDPSLWPSDHAGVWADLDVQ
jgi:endonuclease/exonuclease/phosphatase family metal-dependent hydrolase